MKQLTFLRLSIAAAFVVILSSIGQAIAGPAIVEPEPIVPRLRLSAGVSIRSMSADFHLNERGGADLFSGGNGRVFYSDGSVGPGFESVSGNPQDGTAFGTIDRASQVLNSGRNDINGDPIFSASFHGVQRAKLSDEETSAGPYLQLSYSLIDEDGLILNAITGWSWVRFGLSSGDQPIHTYTYDTTLTGLLPSFPHTDSASPTGNGIFIVDASNPLIAGFGIDPREEVNGAGIARATLDVDLHEIPFGLEFGREFGKLDMLLTAGVTLNVIDFDLNTEFAMKQLAVQRWNSDGSKVKAGGYLGLVGRYPLCASGKVFAEARGSYRWVDSTEVSAGFATVEIDPSSWEGGMGLGILW
jgi:hypothetical protein